MPATRAANGGGDASESGGGEDDESGGGGGGGEGGGGESEQEVAEFVDKDHTRLVDLMVRGEEKWRRRATIFRHDSTRGAVLWFGQMEYEGLCGTYNHQRGALRDSDAVVTYTRLHRWFHCRFDHTDLCGVCDKEQPSSLREHVTTGNAAGLLDTDAADYETRDHESNRIYMASCDKCGVELRVHIA